jgi:tetratricopeptide (TPR) repeat protein
LSDETLETAPRQPTPAIIRRLGIANNSGLSGSVSLYRKQDGTFEMRIDAKRDQLVAELREAIEFAVQKVADTGASEVAGEEKANRTWLELKDQLVATGHDVRDLPLADHKVTFQIDLRTGRTVGVAEELHPLATDSTDIARRILHNVSDSLRGMPTECAREIRVALTNGSVDNALSALRKHDGQGVFSFPPSQDLFDALFEIDVSRVSSADRRFIRERRLLISHELKRHSLHGQEAQLILQEYALELDTNWMSALKMACGIGELHAGHVEAAMAIWQEIAKSPEPLSAGTRAWLYRNMSLAMAPSDPETQMLAKLSSDAFLELGEKDNAVGSLMRAVECSLFENPAGAIALLSAAIGWFPDDSLNSEDRRAWLLISRGKHLLRLRRFAEAWKNAEQAIALRSKHVGQESNLIAALHLAAISSKSMGDTDASESFRQRADQITQQTSSVHFLLAQEVVELFQAYDSERAAALHERAVTASEHEIASAVQLAITQCDESLTVPSRLARLADVVADLQARGVDDEAVEPARMAMLVQLRAIGDERGAVRWCETILAGNPLNEFAEHSFLQACEVLGLHDRAIEHLRAQLRRFGPAPNRLLYLARRFMVAGRASEAIEPLREIRTHADWPDSVRKRADEMLLEILDIADISPKPQSSTPSSTPVLREELERALLRFAATVEAHVRHSFWRTADKSKHWIEKPEGHAQDLLKLFLKAIFQERLDIYEEVAAGAGRIDLALSFAGGLSVILELKMCGAPYSSTYAFNGSDQVLHYMKNLQKSLGYLLIFDARTRDFGKGIDPVTAIANFMVVTSFVDVRPSVS